VSDGRLDRLCAAISEETARCEALLGALRDEQAAVLRLEAEAIFACVARRERLQDDLRRAGGARRAAVAEAAGAFGRSTSSAGELLPHLPLAERGPVEHRVRALRRALLESRGVERETARLVRLNLGAVTELLRGLRALVPGARYGADAEIAVPAPPERVDRRA
jgi:hypothetical protein